MHEFSMVNALMETVLKSAEENDISKVTKVKLIIGELHGALPDLLTFAFETLSQDTVCSGAELEIEIRKLALQCVACGHTFAEEKLPKVCPVCGGYDLKIVAGRELHLDYYEGD